MGSTTEISWADATFNAWRGCTEVSPACDHCYAATMSRRNPAVLGRWGSAADGGTRVVAAEAYWKEPLKWNAEAEAAGIRKRVFCESLGDVFEDWQGRMHNHHEDELCVCSGCGKWVTFRSDCGGSKLLCERLPRPMTMDDVRARLFELIRATPWLDWLLLTKRPENIIRMHPTWSGGKVDGKVPMHHQNVWLGTTVENQEQAVRRIPELLRCRDLAPVLFLSCEPLLGPVGLRSIQAGHASEIFDDVFAGDSIDCLNGEVTADLSGCVCLEEFPCVDWVITGGESGPHARASHPDWFRSLRDQCAAVGVPFHHKQNGEYLHVDDAIRLGLTTTYDGKFQPYDHSLGVPMLRVGKARAGRLLDGVLHDAVPTMERA